MIELFKTALESQTIIILTIIYFYANTIVTYDIRLQQLKMMKSLSTKDMLPSWVAIFIWIQWGIFAALLFLNWKFAIIIFVIRFILKLLPILEIIGEILMLSFTSKKQRIWLKRK